MNAWLIVLIAGLLETGWALGLKYSDGFSKPIPSVLTIVGALASFWLLSIAMKELPVGTAYAVWVGIGAVGTAIWRCSCSAIRSTCGGWSGVLLIIAGIIALKFA